MARAVEMTFSGRLFGRTMTSKVIDAMNNVLEDTNKMVIPALEKRFKKGKGRRSGDLIDSFKSEGLVNDLIAQTVSNDKVLPYIHRVEYGSVKMVGQHQRKNTRAALMKVLKNEMVPALEHYLNG